MIRRHTPSWLGRHEARAVLACFLLVAVLDRQHPHASAPSQMVVLADARPLVPNRGPYYFGGRPSRALGAPIHLGIAPANVWDDIFPGVAELPATLPACIVSLPLATLNADSPKEIAADLPGLYGAPWVASVDGGLIALLNVAVPRQQSRPPATPLLQIYRHGATKPVFSSAVPVTVIRGSRALLYRMFVNGPIMCIDLVIPNGAGMGTAYIYYPFRGQLFETESIFNVQR